MDPVEGQMEAYNARDIEKFLTYFTPDVVAEDGEGNILMRGHQELRERYGPSFLRHPHAHCVSANRLRIGKYVVDEERIAGLRPDGEVRAIIVYRLEGDLIAYWRVLS